MIPLYLNHDSRVRENSEVVIIYPVTSHQSLRLSPGRGYESPWSSRDDAWENSGLNVGKNLENIEKTMTNMGKT